MNTTRLASCAAVFVLALSTPVAGVVISIGSAEGQPGETVPIEVTIDTEGEDVGGIQVDMEFWPEAPMRLMTLEDLSAAWRRFHS